MPVTTFVWDEDSHTFQPEQNHAGLVLELSGMDIRAMSDVWVWAQVAYVWDPTEESVLRVIYSHEMMSFEGSAEVDAPAEVYLHAARVIARRELESQIARRSEWRLRAHNSVVKGKKMRSTFKRGKNAGKEGMVFWVDHRTGRAGLALSDRKIGKNYADVAWLDCEKLESVEPFSPETLDQEAYEVACDFVFAATRGEDLLKLEPKNRIKHLETRIQAKYHEMEAD